MHNIAKILSSNIVTSENDYIDRRQLKVPRVHCNFQSKETNTYLLYYLFDNLSTP